MTGLDLAGRSAIVTGASRGIGEAVARALDGAGARVALVGRDATTLTVVAESLANDSITIVADMADPSAPARIASTAIEEFGTVDVLVNNAAIGARADSTELDAMTIDGIHAVNVRGTLLLSTSLIPAMVATGGGSIVNVSSISGVRGTPRRAAYAASKAAVDGMTRSLAMEFGPAGVRVNAVAPGTITTAMWERNRAIPGVIEQVESQIALRRWGTPEDVADVVLFLASDLSGYVTAQTIEVDGGMASTLDLYGGAV